MITISGFMKTISGTTEIFVIVGVAIEFVPRPIFFCCEKKPCLDSQSKFVVRVVQFCSLFFFYQPIDE